jgi:hypothetical protein
MNNDVTAVFTSCGRQDLLEISLNSFLSHNTHPNVQIVVVEDGSGSRNNGLFKKFDDRCVEWLSTGRRVGQIAAIDLAYSKVKTPYIFHTEDDWEFYAKGFIENSLTILQARFDCVAVLLRALNDLNGHPTEQLEETVSGIGLRMLRIDHCETSFDGQRYVWHGFGFSPGLRRLEDYKRIGPYTKHVRSRPGSALRSEEQIGRLFRNMGFHAAVLTGNGGRGYVRHLGDERRVRDPLLTRIHRRIGRWRAKPQYLSPPVF